MEADNIGKLKLKHEKEAEELRIYWQLLATCPYSCGYCKDGCLDQNTVLILDRIYMMALRIMEAPRKMYYFNFTGSEPALYPFFPELIGYLFSTGANIHVSMETVLSLPLGSPPWSFCLDVAVHPAYIDVIKLVNVIASLCHAQQYVKVRLFQDFDSFKKLEKLFLPCWNVAKKSNLIFRLCQLKTSLKEINMNYGGKKLRIS